MTAVKTDSVDCGDAGQMDMHIWTPGGAHGAGAVLLIQEIFGVGPYIRAVAERLANDGFVVGAPDVFWRFERNWEAEHTEAGMAESFAMVGKLDLPLAIADCVRALDHLGRVDHVGAAPAVLGFCLGGTLAWAVASAGEPSACISYYGSGVAGMLSTIDQISCPTLLHFGNADAFIPNTDVEAVADAIAGRDGFVLNVEHAGHAFDNHESAMFYNEPAAHAAWSKTMAFLNNG